jgi:hypothetical protein
MQHSIFKYSLRQIAATYIRKWIKRAILAMAAIFFGIVTYELFVALLYKLFSTVWEPNWVLSGLFVFHLLVTFILIMVLRAKP